MLSQTCWRERAARKVVPAVEPDKHGGQRTTCGGAPPFKSSEAVEWARSFDSLPRCLSCLLHGLDIALDVGRCQEWGAGWRWQ